MSAGLPCRALGELRPRPPASMSHTAPGRPWQLDSRDWLCRALARDGERTIAQQLGVSRGSVVRARERLGLSAPGRGRRRGTAGASTRQDPPAAFQATSPTALLVLARFTSESRTGGPAATESLLAVRIKAASEARLHGDQLAYEDALLGIASAAGLIHQHTRRLRGAE